MDILTIVVLGTVLLLAGALIGRKLIGRKALAPPRAKPSIPAPTPRVVTNTKGPSMPPPSPPPIRVTAHARAAAAAKQAAAPFKDDSREVEQLRPKLLNCFGGNEGAMTRSMASERKKFPHLSEVELIKKMLYDFGRGR